MDRSYNIAVAGTGYVGLSIATLLAQHNSVTAVDIVPEKVELINNKKSPIQDDYIEKFDHDKDYFVCQFLKKLKKFNLLTTNFPFDNYEKNILQEPFPRFRSYLHHLVHQSF